MNRVYTGGTFNLFHPGHVWFLEQCARIADFVTVGLNTDEFVARYKGSPPEQTYYERAMMLNACRHVDLVIPNVGDEDSRPAIELADPDFVVIGSDWATRDYHAQMGFTREWLDVRNITLLYVDRGAMPQSSTELRERVRG